MSFAIHHVIDGVYISNYRATQCENYLRENGITNVLKLYEDIPFFPIDFNVLETRLADGEFIPLDVLRHGVDFILAQVEAANPVLVVCGAGISRSSTFVLAYLLERGYSLRDAFCLLRKNHRIAQPHPELWQSLITHYGLNYQLLDVLQWRFDED